jgi:large subunit ribosomal protein L19
MNLKLSKNLLIFVENAFLQKLNKKNNFNVGDFVKINYQTFVNCQKKLQIIEGLIVAKKNKGLSKTFTVKRIIQNVGVEQTFFYNSPNILSFLLQKSYKIRRSKLYSNRYLCTKSLKIKD